MIRCVYVSVCLSMCVSVCLSVCVCVYVTDEDLTTFPVDVHCLSKLRACVDLARSIDKAEHRYIQVCVWLQVCEHRYIQVCVCVIAGVWTQVHTGVCVIAGVWLQVCEHRYIQVCVCVIAGVWTQVHTGVCVCDCRCVNTGTYRVGQKKWYLSYNVIYVREVSLFLAHPVQVCVIAGVWTQVHTGVCVWLQVCVCVNTQVSRLTWLEITVEK